MARAQNLESVPTAVREVVDLFHTELNEVRFPGVERDELDRLAREVETHAEAYRLILAQLDGARAELERAQADLLKTARQGMAYARVFAEDDPDLSERLSQLSLAGNRPPKHPARKSRKPRAAGAGTSKPTKAETAVAELPLTMVAGNRR